jgi:hypothetical protein
MIVLGPMRPGVMGVVKGGAGIPAVGVFGAGAEEVLSADC